MEPIIIVFIKLMGTAISGHWDLRDTGTLRDYDTLVRSLGGSQSQALGGSVSVWPVPCPALCLWHAEREQCGQILQPDSPAQKTSHSRQSYMLGCQYGCAQ